MNRTAIWSKICQEFEVPIGRPLDPAMQILEEALCNPDNEDELMVENELDEFADHFKKVIAAFRKSKLESLKQRGK